VNKLSKPTVEHSDPTAFIRQNALEVGFDAVGFACAEPVALEDSGHFREWLAQQYQADMHYLEMHLEKRFDPTLLLPSARTVIVVLQNYYSPASEHSAVSEAKSPPESHSQEEDRTRAISRYALGRDYHRVLGNRLKKLKLRIEAAYPDSEQQFFVDSGPVMERYWAEKAGLGWRGKHTLLITRNFGTWVFIGVMLSSLELKADTPHPDYCGTCTRCLEACPTGAFPQSHLLDSRRCISAWTLEQKQPLGDEQIHLARGCLVGCDHCQQVCPWNRFTQPTRESDVQPRADLLEADLENWSRMTFLEWDQFSRGSAFRRVGYTNFVENARRLLQK